MNASVIAANVTAHWIQVVIVSAAALMALRVLRLRDPKLVIAALQGVLGLALFLPVVQPRQANALAEGDSTAFVLTAVTDEVSAAAPAPESSFSNLTQPEMLLTLVAAGIAIRLLWIAFGLLHLRQMLKSAT